MAKSVQFFEGMLQAEVSEHETRDRSVECLITIGHPCLLSLNMQQETGVKFV